MSETYVIEGLRVADFRQLVIERTPGGQDLEQRSTWHGLDDQSIPFLPKQGLVAWQLQISWNADRLVAAIPKEPHDTLSFHDILPAAKRPMLQLMLSRPGAGARRFEAKARRAPSL
jgi:hypothetical protein